MFLRRLLMVRLRVFGARGPGSMRRLQRGGGAGMEGATMRLNARCPRCSSRLFEDAGDPFCLHCGTLTFSPPPAAAALFRAEVQSHRQSRRNTPVGRRRR